MPADRRKTATVVLLTAWAVTSFWLVYALLGGFTGLYEDRFDCPAKSECRTEDTDG